MKQILLLIGLLLSTSAFGQVLKTSRTDVAISHDDFNEVSAKIVQVPLPDMVAIQAGKFAGLDIVNKVGRNPDVDTATVPEDVWNGGGVYTGFPLPSAAAETIQVFSSDINDAAAGTGARTITLTGLDADWNPRTESFTLNGTTAVTSTTTWRRVHTARVTSAGPGGVNVGTITCRQSSTTSVVFFNMPIGFNQTNMLGYTVPLGYRAFVTKIHGQIRGAAAASVDLNLWIRTFGEVFRSRRPMVIGTDSDYALDVSGGLVLPEKSDIIARVTLASANNLEVIVGYDILLIKNGQ